MKSALTPQLIGSAVFAAMSLAFFYHAAFGSSRYVLHVVLTFLACGFSSLALALQPSALFEVVERDGLRLRWPRANGVASVLNVLSISLLIIACVAWLATLSIE